MKLLELLDELRAGKKLVNPEFGYTETFEFDGCTGSVIDKNGHPHKLTISMLTSERWNVKEPEEKKPDIFIGKLGALQFRDADETEWYITTEDGTLARSIPPESAKSFGLEVDDNGYATLDSINAACLKAGVHYEIKVKVGELDNWRKA